MVLWLVWNISSVNSFVVFTINNFLYPDLWLYAGCCLVQSESSKPPPPPAPNPEEKTPYMYERDQYAGQQIRIKPL